MNWLAKRSLRQLIMGLALVSMLVTVGNMFNVGAKVQKQSLIDNTLQHNQGYAVRLAQTLQLSLTNAQQELAFKAQLLAKQVAQPEQLQQAFLDIAAHDTTYNFMYISNADGALVAAVQEGAVVSEPALLGGAHQQALIQRSSWISEPFVSQQGELQLLLSAPIFSADGEYAGYLAGSIYLHQSNVLQQLIGEHYEKDGSYVYVFDSQLRLLYHPEQQRLGIPVHTNALLPRVLQGAAGAQAVVNSLGVEMLAGYAYVPVAGWGLVSQRPTEALVQAHIGLMQKTMLNSLPVDFIMLLIIGIVSYFITRPLHVLASNAKKMSRSSTIKQVEHLNAWYFEAQTLKQAFLQGLVNVHAKVGRLRESADIDPLTGLKNRRLLDHLMQVFVQARTPFCAIAFDIDNFKAVNDTHGHAVGDQVLQQLAQIVLESTREADVCIRSGGEEFLVIMTDCTPELAAALAERLRTRVMGDDFAEAGQITISVGVAVFPDHSHSPSDTLKLADERLYCAKRQGKNRVCLAGCEALTAVSKHSDQDKNEQ